MAFKALTMGASVTGAANGDFNKWLGFKLGCYSTWGQGGGAVGDEGHYTKQNGGKPWAILSSAAEYGSAKEATLGKFDIDVAPQFYGGDLEYYVDSGGQNRAKVNNHWLKLSQGQIDTFLKAKIQELKTVWGTREGHVFYRPFHEFNGSWYPWSVRNAQDQAYFVTFWKNHLHPIWKSIIGTDARFHLEWSPNRDTSYGLDVRNAFPGAAYVDVIGPDWYDFGVKGKADTQAVWDTETVSTQNNGSPVGLQSWITYAAAQGLPICLPETGQQWGDRPVFCKNLAATIQANRYTGSGTLAGKFLYATWHNLQGSSPDPNAGGDFFIQKGGLNYSGRPNASAQWKASLQGMTLRKLT